MLAYLIRRSLLMIPTLFGITLVVFSVMASSPGGISAQSLIEGNLEPEARRALEDYYNERFGLDEPLPVQYWRWLGNISPVAFPKLDEGLNTGVFKKPDLGMSFLYGRPVIDLIAERLPITLLLNLISLPLVYALAIAIGVRAAMARGKSFDVASGTVLLALWSVPVMLAGILAIGFFASEQNWHWFPEAGLNRREALDMPFLPHWGSLPQAVIYLVGLLITVGLVITLYGRVGRRSKILLMALTGFVGGLAMAESIGQQISTAWHLFITLLTMVVATCVGMSNLLFLGRLICALAAVIGFNCVSVNYLGISIERGFLLDRLWHLVLPVLCLSFGGLAFLAKLTRSAVLENLAADYARTARAKGASEELVLWRHVFRNSLIPLITVAAALLPGLLAGSVVVESLFSIDGMGKLAVEAVKGRDRELVLSLTLISGVLTLIGYLFADICYAIADPRVSYD